MTNVEALKNLYAALGGDAANVADVETNVGVLNDISAMYGGESDASSNADAIANIAAVADQIGGGGSGDFTTAQVTIKNNGSSTVTINCPCLYGDGSITSTNYYYSAVPGEKTITVIMSSHGAVLQTGSTPASTSGSIAGVAPNTYNVTGDCTITFS